MCSRLRGRTFVLTMLLINARNQSNQQAIWPRLEERLRYLETQNQSPRYCTTCKEIKTGVFLGKSKDDLTCNGCYQKTRYQEIKAIDFLLTQIHTKELDNIKGSI